MTNRSSRRPAARQRVLPPLLLFAFAALFLFPHGASWAAPPASLESDAPPPLPKPLMLPGEPIAPGASVGTLPGTWEVTPRGQFLYTIPLVVPDGRAGMQPSLSLEYASSGGNGFVGVGWSLSGTSSITRCRKTLRTEGVTAGVSYTEADRFCLDGQKLIAVGGLDYSTGDYGDIDTEYRTETDSFARIVSTGPSTVDGRGPEEFLVFTRDGRIRTYSAQVVSRYQYRALAGGLTQQSWVDSPRAMWLLASERDRAGNEITYEYKAGNGEEVLPYRIRYTAHLGDLPSQRYVQFDYEDRPDVGFGWISGVRYTRTQRLRAIRMFAPNPRSTEEVWRYDLTYLQSPDTQRSLLQSVKRCGAKGGCLWGKQFAWHERPQGSLFNRRPIGFHKANVFVPWDDGIPASEEIPLYSDLSHWDPPMAKVLDLDGDGMDDVVYFPGTPGGTDASQQSLSIRLGQRSGGAAAPLGRLFTQSDPWPSLTHARPVDIDGDGIDELWGDILDTQHRCMQTPLRWSNAGVPSFVPVELNVSVPCSSPQNTKVYDSDFADLNGDGLLDLVVESSGGMNLPVHKYVRMNQGARNFGPMQYTGIGEECAVRATDLDGDGRGDYLALCPGSPARTITTDDAGLGTVRTLQDEVPEPKPGVHMGDFNGDGLEDALIYNPFDSSAAHIEWNTGNGFLKDPAPIALPHDVGWQYAGVKHAFDNEGIRIRDVNGDGLDDIVSFHKLPTEDITVLLSRGTGAFTAIDLHEDPGFQDAKHGWTSSQLGDFNGDGHPDIVKISANTMVVLEQVEGFADRLKSVRDEATPWPRETVEYTSQGSEHGEQHDCAYPLQCIRRGLTVVRKVESCAHLVNPADVAAEARVFRYSYEDPVADLRGGGFLGFGTFRIWDEQRPAETVITFDHRRADGGRYPYASVPASITTAVPLLSQGEVAGKPYSPKARISRISYSYTPHAASKGGPWSWSEVASVSETWEQHVTVNWGDPTGAHITEIGVPKEPVRRVYAHTDYDDHGNAVYSYRGTEGGSEQFAITSYDIREDDWLVSLPSFQMVTASEADSASPPVTRKVVFLHDALGQLEKIEIEKGDANPDVPETITLGHDAYGLLTSITRAAAGEPARKGHVEYAPVFPEAPDERVYPSQVWAEHDNAAFRPSQWVAIHPAYGVAVAAMDVNGVSSTATYDDLGRLLSEQREGEDATSLTYRGRPDLGGGFNGTITEALTGAQVVTTEVDALGRTLSESAKGFDGVSHLATWITYDRLGRVATTATPVSPYSYQRRTTTYIHDSLDRLLETQWPDSTKARHSYSLFEAHSRDENNSERYVTYDNDGRVSASIDVLNQPASEVRTEYGYAPFGLVERVTDPKGNATRLSYDVRGRRVQVEEPDRGATRTAYNGFGDVRSERHLATGQQKTFVRDDLGRTTFIESPDGLTAFHWDTSPHGIGELALAESPDQVDTSYRYDLLGRLAGMDLFGAGMGGDYSVDLSYDPHGRLETLAYPEVPGRNRFTVKYTHNALGYLQEVGDASPGQPYKALWTVKERNLDLSLLRGTLGNGVELRGDYYPLTGELMNLRAAGKAGTGADLFNLHYDYHPNGLVKQRLDSVAGRSEIFGYDSLLRLRSWRLRADGSSDSSVRATDFSYDALGNLTEVYRNEALAQKNTYGLPDGSQPHTLTDQLDAKSGAHTGYAYDALGRQIAGAGRSVPAYTTFDLPRRVIAGGTAINFAYDAQGQRVRKIDGASNTVYVPGLYERREVGGAVEHVFHVEGSDGEVAQVVFDEPAQETKVHYTITDPLGSVGAVLDEGGNVTERLFFEPFGQRIQADGSALGGMKGKIKNGFAGHEHDDELGLINMRGRLFDPALKRFLTPDPIVSFPGFGQSWNPYAYALNSPLNFVDPSGLQICTLLGVCYPTGDEGGAGGGNNGSGIRGGDGWGGSPGLTGQLGGPLAGGLGGGDGRPGSSTEQGYRAPRADIRPGSRWEEYLADNSTGASGASGVQAGGGTSTAAHTARLWLPVTRPFSQAFKDVILSLYEKLGYKDWELDLVRKTLECVDVTCAAARAEADKRIEQAKQKSEAGTQSQSTGGNATRGEGVGNVLKDATPGKVSKPGMGSTHYSKSGGFERANADFDSLAGSSPIKRYPGDIRSTTLPDGTKVSVRPGSSQGDPTLQVEMPGQNPIKVRYGQ